MKNSYAYKFWMNVLTKLFEKLDPDSTKIPGPQVCIEQRRGGGVEGKWDQRLEDLFFILSLCKLFDPLSAELGT